MKKKGFKLLALAVITACCFGISAASAFAADVKPKTAMNGASIRTVEPTGLRFEAIVDETTYNSVINANDKSFGAFILPKDYLTAANITAITNHKEQFEKINEKYKYLEKEGIEGEQNGSEYVLKYSIANLHYYNYNREFVGMFFIKTTGESGSTYTYFAAEDKNVRSLSFVANSTIESGKFEGDERENDAYTFALKGAYLAVNPYDKTQEEKAQNTAATNYATEHISAAKDLYAKVKAVAAISAINVWDSEQEAAINEYNEAYDKADDVLKAWIAGISSYGTCTANATEFAAKSLTAVADLKASINKLPAASEITVLSKAKVAELKSILEIAKGELGSEYEALSAKLNAAENAINQNYKVLIDMSAPVYAGTSADIADVKEDTIMYNTHYTAPKNLAETKTQQVDDVYGSYLGSKFKNQELDYLHICFYYKLSEAVKTSIQSFDKVCMFVYNGSASDKDVLHNFGDGDLHTEYSGVKFKAGEWTLLTVPKDDFLNGYYYGIMGAQIKNTEYKFSTVFATDAEGLAKLNVYTSGIIDAINNLPDAPETVGSETTIPAEVDAVITAYEAFGASERAIIDANPAARAKLEAWIYVKQQVAVSYVVKAIENMEEYNVSTVPVVYNKNYKTVKAAYDGLTEEQKKDINNYAKLQKYVDAAKNVKSLYTSIDNFTSSVAVTAEGPGSVKGVDDDYGDIYKIRGQVKGNVYLTFNSYADLTDYDVVRFPIYMTGEANQYSLHKYSIDNGLVGYYSLLTPGWNIITVPVSYMMNGFVLGGSELPGMTWLYYAVPYMEKLENGDAIASYKYKNDGIIIGGATDSFSESYTAKVDVTAQQDETLGTIMYLDITKAGGAPENYAFRFTNAADLKSIVAETRASSVKFKIKASRTNMVYFTSATSGHGTGIKAIDLTTAWTEVEITAEEFAQWNGYFRRDGVAPIQLWISDFTIVK